MSNAERPVSKVLHMPALSPDKLLAKLRECEQFIVCYRKVNGKESVRTGSLNIEDYLTGTGTPHTDPDECVYLDEYYEKRGSDRPLRSFKWSRVHWIRIGDHWYQVAGNE